MKTSDAAVFVFALILSTSQSAFASFDENDLHYLTDHQNTDVIPAPTPVQTIQIEPRSNYVQYLGVPIKPAVTGLSAKAHSLLEQSQSKQIVSADILKRQRMSIDALSNGQAQLKVEGNLLPKSVSASQK